MLCVKCLKEKPPGHEHIIARALGGLLTIDRVCSACDSTFGATVDAGLIHHYKVEKRRHQLGLAGYSGAVPNPLKTVLKNPFEKIDDPENKLVMRIDNAGNATPYLVPKVKPDVQTFPGNLYRIEINPGNFRLDQVDMSKAEELFKKALRRQGLTNPEACDEAWTKFAPLLEQSEERAVWQSRVSIRGGGHELGVLKIAYEMAWYWLGDDWLSDPVAEAMRELLDGKIPESFEGAVFDDPDKILIVRGGDPRAQHAVFLLPWRLGYLIGVRLFDVFTGMFVVTNDARRYAHPESDAIIMNVCEKTKVDTSFYELIYGVSGLGVASTVR